MHHSFRQFPRRVTLGTVSLILFLNLISMATTFHDPSLGFSMTLPTGWRDSLIGPREHLYLYQDTTYKAMIGVVDYAIDSSMTSKEWCKNSSSAYAAAVAGDSLFGVIYALDSTVQDSLFTMYSNSEYGYPIHTELIRWIGSGRNGYELYVFGDTIDVPFHFVEYKSYLDSFRIEASQNTVEKQGTKASPSADAPHVFPNPCSGYLNIDFGQEIVSAKLIRIDGRVVWKNDVIQSGKSVERVDTRNLANGIYLLRYSTIQGKSGATPIIQIGR